MKTTIPITLIILIIPNDTFETMAKNQLSPEIDSFIKRQLADWPLAGVNYVNLVKIERKPFSAGALKGFVQYNPGRIASNTAKVDAGSVSERKCFLCDENRPSQQESLNIIPGWKILLNPFPILENHLTISSESHIPQQLHPEAAVQLTKHLPGMIVFYNDDGAGASAPDHRHFQAVTFGELPLVNFVDKNFGNPYLLNELPFLIRTGEISDSLSADDELEKRILKEKPLNAFFWNTSAGRIRYIFIPRKAHRPDYFYLEPPLRRSFSPGALDMAGILVTPFREDFNAVTDIEIQEIYEQVAFKPSSHEG